MRAMLLGGAAVLAAQLPASGTVIRVPEDYPSVLAGVDAAVAGDSVLVGPGTWTDHEVRTVNVLGTPLALQGAAFLKPGITVVGTAGSEETILDGGEVVANSVDTVIHVLAGSLVTRFVGFTITGDGNGVLATGASPLELVDCRIVENTRQGILSRESETTLRDCLVSQNHGDGGMVGHDVDVTCEGCVFAENVGPGLHVSKTQDPTMTVVLRDCVFRDHRGRRGVVVGDAAVTIERCLFLRNSTPGGNGGGLSLVRCGGEVRFSTFAFDSAESGGGVGMSLSNVRIENNTFVRCHSWIAGGGLSIGGTDAGSAGNILAGSTGRRGAVYKTGGPTHPDTGCNLFWDNADGDYYGDWVPAPTDLHTDPLFCDPVTLDFTLQADSPAAPLHSPICGLIGAHDVGCGSVSVKAETWGRIKSWHR